MKTSFGARLAAEAKTTILIVDDAEDVRRDLRTVLQLYHDLEVVGQAVNGVEAISLADELRPDVVLMDLRLPGLDGFEATEQIRRRALAGSVIMLTIYDDRENRARAARAGIDLFLVKGLSIDDLVAAIRQVSRSNAAEGAGRLTGKEKGGHDGTL